LSPFAHFGVPQIVISTSMPLACALRTSSSTSSSLYDGSNGLAGFAGFVGATLAHVTSVRMIVACSKTALSSSSIRPSFHLNTGSSWNPIHIRSAALAPETTASATSRVTTNERSSSFTGGSSSESGPGQATHRL
jgi:hypothetical protein